MSALSNCQKENAKLRLQLKYAKEDLQAATDRMNFYVKDYWKMFSDFEKKVIRERNKGYLNGYIQGGLDILTNQKLLDQYLEDIHSETPFSCLSSSELYLITQGYN